MPAKQVVSGFFLTFFLKQTESCREARKLPDHLLCSLSQALTQLFWCPRYVYGRQILRGLLIEIALMRKLQYNLQKKKTHPKKSQYLGSQRIMVKKKKGGNVQCCFAVSFSWCILEVITSIYLSCPEVELLQHGTWQ